MSRNAGVSRLTSAQDTLRSTGLISGVNWVSGKTYEAGTVVTDGSHYYLAVKANADTSLSTGNWLTLAAGSLMPIIIPNDDAATSGGLTKNTQAYINTGGVNRTRSLPSTGCALGDQIYVSKSDVDTSAATITVTGTINGVTTPKVITTKGEGQLFVCDASNTWWTFPGRVDLAQLDGRYGPLWTQTFTFSGALSTGVLPARFPLPYASTFHRVDALVNTAPSTTSTVIDILKGNAGSAASSIYAGATGNRPTLLSGTNKSTVSTFGTAPPSTTSAAADDYIQAQILSVGAPVAGSDLTVTISYLINALT